MTARTSKRVFLHAITPVHSGTGQAADAVDLPIAREKATGWPVIPGSSIKGVLASEYEKKTDKARREGLYGSQKAAGKLSFTDMRILCLPVRSFFGTFAWVTSPLALGRFSRDAKALEAPLELELPHEAIDQTKALVTQDSLLVNQDSIYLEDLNLLAVRSGCPQSVAHMLKREMGSDAPKDLEKRLAIVSDTVFDFLCETSLEVFARIALGEGGTTDSKGGNLWYEEAVPSETLFAGFLLVSDGASDEIKTCTIQIGGNAGVGRGICRLVVQP